jgi:hypothetical protein
MRYQATICAAIVLVAAAAHARDQARDESELLRTEAALCHAFEAGDAVALGKGLDPRFTLTSSNGEVTDRAETIAEVAKREPYYEVFRNSGQKVRLYGDAAIVTGITTIKGHSGATGIAADFQYTDTWIHRDDAWMLAASHASRLRK